MSKLIRAFIPFFIFGILCILGNIIFMFFLITQLYRLNIIKNMSRDIVMVSWRFFLWLIKSSKWISYYQLHINIKGTGNLIIANHPSLLDVVFLLAYIRHANCVVKKELKSNLFLYPAIKCSHYITNDFSENFLNKCITVLHNQENLIIFPEGTRTIDKINIHKGASYIAIHGAKNIIPFFITITPKCLGKNDKWYNLPKDIHYNIQQLDEIHIPHFESNNVISIRTRHLHSYIKSIYENIN